MIELNQDKLCFSFPSIAEELDRLAEAHVAAKLPAILAEDRIAAVKQYLGDRRITVRSTCPDLTDQQITDTLRSHVRNEVRGYGPLPGHVEIEFQRTLRIPDDGRDYPLPPGLGCFPLRHVDDHEDRVPAQWLERGGVMMPLYQSEALWLNFHSSYPFTVKVGSGKINAVTGEPWRAGLNRAPQDYLVLPEQPWLDGFSVEKGVIRQFVAMPLGAGYSVEEQLSGKAEFGGIQLEVRPMKAEVYFREQVLPHLPQTLADLLPALLPVPLRRRGSGICFSKVMAPAGAGLGLGAGGRMKQEIYEDEHPADVWDLENSSRCFVHLCDALVWRKLTGSNPPHTPATAKEYEEAGMPWFDFYRDDVAVLEGSKTLAGVKSVAQISQEKGDMAIKGNDSVKIPALVHCGPGKRSSNAVREWQG